MIPPLPPVPPPPPPPLPSPPLPSPPLPPLFNAATIPSLVGYSQDKSVLLHIDSDQVKETLLLNVQPIIRESIKNSNPTETQEKIALLIKQLPIPTLTYLKRENMWNKNSRYYSTNPNGACGYILLYQLQERLPTKLPRSIDLYQPSTRNKFISFLNYQKSHINTLQFNHHIELKEEISLRISETVKWVTSSFQSNTNRISPFLPQSHWFTDTYLPYLKIQNRPLHIFQYFSRIHWIS